MRLRHPLLAALLLAHTAGAALAADWQLVLSDRSRRVEIDRGSILSSDAGTKISWGRVVLTTDEAKASGYAMIKALNRYDCRNRTFVTVKRVYVDAGDNIVREESVPDSTPLTVARNSVDERMWREVCNPPSVADLQKLASAAARLAAAPAATPLAAARPEPAAPPALVRTGETALPAAAQSAAPPLETHVEIPAKFLPGGSQAGESSTPRKSILPPLPGIAAKADAGAGAAPAPQAAPSAEARKSGRAVLAVAPPTPAAKPAPALSPAAVVVAARAEPSAKPVAPTFTSAAPAQRATSRPPPEPSAAPMARPRVARAQPTMEARQRAVRPPARAHEVSQPTPQVATSLATRLEASGIRVTTLPAGTAGWSYDGESGPQNWGRLRPEWRTCAEGTRQSPIDLRDGIAVDLAPVKFDYGRSGFRIRDTGNTLQVDVGEGMGVTVRGVRYALERFTLHRPSQDRVGGMAHDMAIYLEHRSTDGKQAIVSVLLAAASTAHPVLQTLWSNLPLDRGREFSPDAVIDLAQLVPADPGHFLYTGSLPTPPCTEDVLWVVMKQPLPIADDQLAVFARLYPRNGRPIQPANGRLLLESR